MNKMDEALANAIIETLWIKGLLTDSEQAKIKNKLAETFSLKKVKQSTGRNELVPV